MTRLVAVEIGAFPDGLLETLVRKVGSMMGLEVSSSQQRLDPAMAYDERRKQLLAARLLTELRQIGKEDERLIGAASLDLFNPVLTFVFGEAEMPGRAAVFSIHRLRQEFYGLPPDSRLLEERAAKEMLHELGHTFGLTHCPDVSCVMSSCHSVEAVDLKSETLCRRCGSRLGN